ncbi:hypothetical protein [Jiulongibacter sediminis]|uniref:DUF4402 domain-containing protein n=1 Tax=Jiulongibacter sediminis TaxID=1605367 RepID=A0A0P7C033_9BACT|nr:hypothetical protein [Jiulongibacter sediminis]KPM47875.1 hypothetical protein AFM12_11605 [Jiulongibacter sediminis]TBX24059.1 hypothetical protein TK44_11615 [Jiulongibacter sediminis]
MKKSLLTVAFAFFGFAGFSQNFNVSVSIPPVMSFQTTPGEDVTVSATETDLDGGTLSASGSHSYKIKTNQLWQITAAADGDITNESDGAFSIPVSNLTVGGQAMSTTGATVETGGRGKEKTGTIAYNLTYTPADLYVLEPGTYSATITYTLEAQP